MKRIETKLPGVCIVEPDVHGDHRGYFMKTYNQKAFEEIGITAVFVQDNRSFTAQKGTLRGIRFNDPDIGVAWGVENPILSGKDTTSPMLSGSDCNFVYGDI